MYQLREVLEKRTRSAGTGILLPVCCGTCIPGWIICDGVYPIVGQIVPLFFLELRYFL